MAEPGAPSTVNVPSLSEILEAADVSLYEVRSHGSGPAGVLPFSYDELISKPSGDLFGWSQDAGMGWDPRELRRPEVLILSTQGGLRDDNGQPVALGYHTGHWEIGLLVRAAAQALRRLGTIPFAGYCSDPCDGRTQGTTGMMDSLPYRNDAAQVFRRLIRSLPQRTGVLGIATCDKGLPAMLMALASCLRLPTILIPGGVMLAPEAGAEDTARIQTIGARAAHGLLSLEAAAELGCRACASPGGGCQFLGTAATSQVVAEALGLALPHSALSPSGQPIWTNMAERSAAALVRMVRAGMTTSDILTPAAIHNAMVVHAAFGGSTNLLIHLPAIAHAAGLPRPTVAEWIAVNRQTPRLVDALPNGPIGHPTIRVFLAGGVPEVMLHLRDLGLIDTSALNCSGQTWDAVLNWWENSERRQRLRASLSAQGVDPESVIMTPQRARAQGLTSTLCFPTGNIAPEGSVIKSTAVDPSLFDASGVYRHVGPARIFAAEADAITAIKSTGPGALQPGDVLVLMGRGPAGAGMEEIYQITSALRHLPIGHSVAVLTDARFSGVSTGPCIGHISPEALAGGPLGKLRDGDIIEIKIDTNRLEGGINFVGTPHHRVAAAAASAMLAERTPHPALRPDPALPDDTRLWAALQGVSGGVWGGCVFDVDQICARLQSGNDPASPRVSGIEP